MPNIKCFGQIASEEMSLCLKLWTTDGRRRTDTGSWPSYKLTFEPRLGSGELKIEALNEGIIILELVMQKQVYVSHWKYLTMHKTNEPYCCF